MAAARPSAHFLSRIRVRDRPRSCLTAGCLPTAGEAHAPPRPGLCAAVPLVPDGNTPRGRCGAARGARADRQAGARPAPELRWLGPPPLRARELCGKVVWVRWWSDARPMCSGALPSLAGICTQQRRDGLVVIGIYHPKPQRALSDAEGMSNMPAINREQRRDSSDFRGAMIPL